MEQELSRQEKKIILQKYKGYTLTEFAIKPEMILQYVFIN